jgi:hypothetical protein
MNLSWGGGATASALEFSRIGNVFCAYATGTTSLPAYTQTALGPLLWNGSSQNPQLKAVILGAAITVTTASGAAVSVGLAWGTSILPAAQTAITKVTSTYANGAQPVCSAYNAGKVSTAPLGYMPFWDVDTAALTTAPLGSMWIPMDGMFVIPPGSFIALAASATATSAVLDFGIIWAEVTR